MTLNLDPIIQRANAASAGPWSVRHEHYEAGPGPDDEEQDWYLIDDCYAVEHWANYDKETTEFIAAARTDVPALVAEVERLQGIVDRVREKVSVARHAIHLTGTLDAREVLHHIATAMEDQ